MGLALDVSDLSGKWKNLSWATVQSQAAWRIFHPEAIDQASLSTTASLIR